MLEERRLGAFFASDRLHAFHECRNFRFLWPESSQALRVPYDSGLSDPSYTPTIRFPKLLVVALPSPANALLSRDVTPANWCWGPTRFATLVQFLQIAFYRRGFCILCWLRLYAKQMVLEQLYHPHLRVALPHSRIRPT